ncbi:MAG: HD-GYP domain-containing protein [Gammaproteobacteria bacterium]
MDAKKTTRIEKIRLPVGALEIGMYVAELDIPWLESSFVFQGFIVKTQKQLDKIREVCDYVYIEVDHEQAYLYRAYQDKAAFKPYTPQKVKTFFSSLFSKKSSSSPVEDHKPFTREWLIERQPPDKTATFEQEYVNAEAVHIGARHVIQEVMSDIASGKSIDVKLAKEVVADCVNSILRNPDALMLLTQMKNRDEYTAQHSMNVCMLAITMGRFLNLSVSQLNELGLCGMMHDMGKMKVPLEILNKPGRLDEEETIIMHNHTIWGYVLLNECSGISKIAKEVALSHHERYDGRGYPRKLLGKEILPYAQIVAIVDMYDAVTSNRVYQEGRSHLEALNLMVESSPNHLEPCLVERFIKCVGIYPPGCLVLLNTGEIGVVTEINSQYRLRPKIILLLDENKQPCEEKMFDLAETSANAPHKSCVIKSVVRPEVYNININHYREKGIFMMRK